MRTKLGRALALCSLTVAATPLLAQDLTIVFKETSGSGAPATTAQYYTKAKNRTNGVDRDILIDYATGTITTIDHKKKEYSEITAAEIEASMKKMSAEMEKMNAQMANMPPAVKEKMEQMMGGGGTVTVTRGGTKKIAGYDAQQYTVAFGQMMNMETWNTTALKYPIPEADLKRYASLAGSASTIAANPMFQGLGKVADEMKKIEGMALAQTTTFKMMGKSNVTTKEAVEVKLDPVPDSVFALPAGYKKVASPMAKMAK
jgi:hypothetical protein